MKALMGTLKESFLGLASPIYYLGTFTEMSTRQINTSLPLIEIFIDSCLSMFYAPELHNIQSNFFVVAFQIRIQLE
jgi:hypothetical protein